MIVTKYNLNHKIQPTYKAYDLILYETIKDKAKQAVLTAQQIAKLATSPQSSTSSKLSPKRKSLGNIQLTPKQATK